MEISIDDLQAILKIFRDSDLEQMYIEIGDLKFEISKAGGVISSAPVRKAQRSAGPSPAPLQLEQQGEAEVPATVQPAVSRLGERTGLIAIDAPARARSGAVRTDRGGGPHRGPGLHHRSNEALPSSGKPSQRSHRRNLR